MAFHTQLGTSIGVTSTSSPHNGTMTSLPYVCSVGSVTQVTSALGKGKSALLVVFICLYCFGGAKRGTLGVQGVIPTRQGLAMLNLRI